MALRDTLRTELTSRRRQYRTGYRRASRAREVDLVSKLELHKAQKKKAAAKAKANEFRLRAVPGFKLKVFKHAGNWYLTTGGDDPMATVIGGYHSSMRAAVKYAQDNYADQGYAESVREKKEPKLKVGQVLQIGYRVPPFLGDDRVEVVKIQRQKGKRGAVSFRYYVQAVGAPDRKGWLDHGDMIESVREGVADTIWQQITTSTKMSVGARTPVGGGNKIHFNVGRGKKNKIEVVYQPGRDTYTVNLWKFSGDYLKQEIVESMDNVYVDNLNDVIYRMTHR